MWRKKNAKTRSLAVSLDRAPKTLLSLCLEEEIVREMPESFFKCSADSPLQAKNTVGGAY